MQNRKREEASEMFLGVELFSNQLMACKQTDNHWLYLRSELSNVENIVREICSCCCVSCVSVPSVRNTKKLRDKPNLLASIRAASDGAGAGSDSLAPARPGR